MTTFFDPFCHPYAESSEKVVILDPFFDPFAIMAKGAISIANITGFSRGYFDRSGQTCQGVKKGVKNGQKGVKNGHFDHFIDPF